ncbi:hypothetical protein ACFPYJ_15750 [Paenibacillus solisilvae]|uniref:LLM class flavin-dependent oxidoreductase n=1 Tax=Paenibacillus solisilvae TaxID=2486751 RepID=A0ABW0W2A2_9BACL
MMQDRFHGANPPANFHAADSRYWMDAVELAKREGADVLSVYVSESGGLFSDLKAFSIAEAADMLALNGSQCGMGIATPSFILPLIPFPKIIGEFPSRAAYLSPPHGQVE